MPCDCSPSHFDVRSHYNISYIDIISTDLLVALNNSHIMYPRKTVGADAIYDELPPGDVIKSLHLERAAINQDEFSRAEWFWNRRPKLLCETLTFYFCYIVVFCCLFYLVPKNVPLVLLWFVAGVGCAFVDCVRIDRWRNEYKSSIKRVILHRSER
jgi:hypothetical protein